MFLEIVFIILAVIAIYASFYSIEYIFDKNSFKIIDDTESLSGIIQSIDSISSEQEREEVVAKLMAIKDVIDCRIETLRKELNKRYWWKGRFVKFEKITEGLFKLHLERQKISNTLFYLRDKRLDYKLDLVTSEKQQNSNSKEDEKR